MFYKLDQASTPDLRLIQKVEPVKTAAITNRPFYGSIIWQTIQRVYWLTFEYGTSPIFRSPLNIENIKNKNLVQWVFEYQTSFVF